MAIQLVPILVGVGLSIAFRFMVALGLGLLTFTVALPNILSFIQNNFSNLPPDVLAMLGVLRVDIAITILLSAAAAKVIYRISAAPLISLGS